MLGYPQLGPRSSAITSRCWPGRCGVGAAQGQDRVNTNSPGRRVLDCQFGGSKVSVGPAGPSGAGRAGASSGRLRASRGAAALCRRATRGLPFPANRGPGSRSSARYGPQRGRMGRGGGAPVWSIDPTSPPPARPDWVGRTPRLPALAPARAWPGSRWSHTPLSSGRVQLTHGLSPPF